MFSPKYEQFFARFGAEATRFSSFITCRITFSESVTPALSIPNKYGDNHILLCFREISMCSAHERADISLARS